MRSFKLGILVTVLICAVGQISAHHSTALYVVRVTKFEGVLVEISWRNPHIQLVVDAINERGQPELVQFIGDNIKNLEHAGLGRKMLKDGERVKIAGRRSGREPHLVLAQTIEFADGSKYKLWLGAEP